jgi:glycine cleavage system H protein
MIRYSDEHVWIRMEGDLGVVGITAHAQETLGDIVFVDLPAIGKLCVQHEVAGVVESVKAAADVFTPVAGEIVAVNEQVRDNPALANTDPQGDGWFFKMKLVHQEELDTLMDEGTYVMFLQNI